MNRPTKDHCREGYKISYKWNDADISVYLTGNFDLKNLMAFNSDIRREISGKKPKSATFDFSEVSYLDSAAALAFLQIGKDINNKDAQFKIVNLNDESKGIFSVIHENALHLQPFKSLENKDSLVRKIGQASFDIANDFVDFVTFFGELLIAFFRILKNPRTLRWKDMLFYIQRAGVDGLPIVALIGLLMGLIIAFMSFLQLKMVGANIYVPALVSFALVKELGPIMTAILVAGRSGSAYAAEIGTMMVNEEVDALHTMGFDPVRFLVAPKVLATVIVVPLLTVYADFFGILGGMIIGITSLDLTVKTYVTQSLKTIHVFDIVTSLIKAGVFAALIAAVGCQKGFQVRSGAQDVGKFTTSSVVASIFLIVLVDSVFAIMFYYLE